MIFQLLKQVPPALARFIVYRMRGARSFSAPVATGYAEPAAAKAPAVGQMTVPPIAAPPTAAPPIAATQMAVDETSPAHAKVNLGAQYLALADWPVYRLNEEPDELVAAELYKLWLTIPNGHKWGHYFEVYRKVFETRRLQPLRILEIGVYLGSSLSLWRKYFSHASTLVVGIDIQPNCAQFAAPADGIEVRIGSQTDAIFLQQVVAEFGPFDIIIDDGSHHTAHQIQSFNHLFAGGLKPGGLYLVEDLHASYWPGWIDSEKTFLDICKELIELMHAHYRRDDLAQTFARHSPDLHASIQVPAITRMLGEIRMFDSIAAIEKVDRQYVPYYTTLEKPPVAS